MTTAILVPSLNRPQRLRDLVANIHEATAWPHRIMFCVSDDESREIVRELDEWYITDHDVDDRRYVTRMNKLVAMLDDDITEMFFGSDDVTHHEGWLEKALTVLQTSAVVVVNDWKNQNGTQAVMRRDYLERAVFDAPGLAFHPGYRHNFADNEQFSTAMFNGEFARALDAVVEHHHPLFGGPDAAPWDATYRNASHGWDHDAALFQSRMALLAASRS